MSTHPAVFTEQHSPDRFEDVCGVRVATERAATGRVE